MANDSNTRSTNQPENSRERRGNETKRKCNDKKTSVKLRSGEGSETQVKIVTTEDANTVHTGNDKNDNKQQKDIGDQAVDGQEGKDNSIVGAEVAQVEVDTRLSINPALRLRHALDIKEVSDGL